MTFATDFSRLNSRKPLSRERGGGFIMLRFIGVRLLNALTGTAGRPPPRGGARLHLFIFIGELRR